MKRRIVCSIFMLQVVLLGSAYAVQVGVVNMERLIEAHPRTAQDRIILERYIQDFDEERDERLQALQTKSEEFERLREEAEDIGLTAEAARERRQRAQMKLEALRRGEASLRELAVQRQQELTSQEMRMRERVMRDIKRLLRDFAEEHSLDLILDGGEDPAGGYGAVIFAQDSFEMTDKVIDKLRESNETRSDS